MPQTNQLMLSVVLGGLGLYFSVLNGRGLLRYAQFQRVRPTAVLTWALPQPRHYALQLILGVVSGAVAVLNATMTLYLMTVYSDPKVRREFQIAYKKTGKKLDMGGCCVHFKKLDDLPLDVVGDTIARVAVDEYVERYETSRTKKNPKKKTKKAKR